MGIFTNFLRIFRKSKQQGFVVYRTDNYEQAQFVASQNKGISVVYHNPDKKISPLLHFKESGNIISKWNPEYVSYLKDKYPNISNAEIAKCIDEAYNSQSEMSQNNEIEKNITSKK